MVEAIRMGMTVMKAATMKVQEFRAASYVDLYSRFKASHERLLQSGRIDGQYHRKVADSQNIEMNKT